MTRTILLLQLAFNIVMLAALAVLVWGARGALATARAARLGRCTKTRRRRRP